MFHLFICLLLVAACFADKGRQDYAQCITAKYGNKVVGNFRWNVKETQNEETFENEIELDMLVYIAAGDNVRCFFGVRNPPGNVGQAKPFPLTYHINDGSSLSSHFTTDNHQTFSVNMPTAHVHEKNNCAFYLKYPITHDLVDFSKMFDGTEALLSLFGYTSASLNDVSKFWDDPAVRYGFTGWNLFETESSSDNCLIVEVSKLEFKSQMSEVTATPSSQ